MAFFSSDNDVNVRVTSTADTDGIDKTKRSINELDKSSNTSAGSAAALGIAHTAAIAGVTALGAATGFAAYQAIKGSSAYEQNRVAFDVMLGSADKARTLMSQISDFAKSTPFQLPEVVAASKQLLAYGFAQEQVIPTMRRLGDVAAGVGIPVSQLTNVFGQVRVAGKLMGQDLLQFTQAGVPMLDYLSQTMHKTTAQIKNDMEKGVGPTFQDVQNALNAMTDSGGRFGGMMEKQSHTLGGVFSNLQDAFGGVLRGVMGLGSNGDIAKGGLFDKLKQGAEAAMPAMQNLANNAGPAVSKGLEKISPAINNIINGFKEVNKVIAPILTPSLKALAKAFEGIAPMLANMAPVLLNVAKVIGGLVVVQLWLWINAFRILIEISTFLWNTVADMAKGIGAAFEWIVGRAIWLKDNFWTVVGNIIGFFATLPLLLPKLMADAVIGIATFVINYDWVGMWRGLVNAGKNAALEIWWAINGAWQKMVGLNWGAIMANVGKGIANAIIDMINGAIKAAFKGVPGLKDHIPQVPHFAHGVRNFGGGMAVVGDVNGMGGELVELPRGSNVYSNHDSKAMGGGSQSIVYNIAKIEVTTAEAMRELLSIQDRNGVLASKGVSLVR
jgi:hypothetical protein